MSVQVAVCTAAQIFSPALWVESSSSDAAIVTKEGKPVSGRLRIPEYQRPYRWGEKQIMGLLEDIRKQNERNKRKDLDLNYYLGSLILHQNEGWLDIIDGQQRLTTLAILASLLHPNDESLVALQNGLAFEHEVSQQQIIKNLKWLRAFFDDSTENWQEHINLNQLEFSLVVTESEDDAYRFFETQNTGGRRLSGPDIIKAHHLRAIKDPYYQKHFALYWEGLGKLDDVVDSLLKGRYWQAIQMRELPSHRQKNAVRDCIVAEFGEDTGNGSEDIAYGRTRLNIGLAGEVTQHFAQHGYDVRQPLNAGINSIRYLAYFQQLNQRYWQELHLPHLAEYQKFVQWLQGREGCGYLEELYKTCLLAYISQFGEEKLEIAAKKLFRVVYSRRVSNQKAVRENSIYAFVNESNVLDWIALSYTPEQCFRRLDGFELKVNDSNLNPKDNSVKKRFVKACCDFFEIGWQEQLEKNELATFFAKNLSQTIRALK